MASRASSRRAPTSAPAPPEPRAPTRLQKLLQRLADHEHRTAAGLFALFVLVYLWPVLLGGGILQPLTGLYFAVPWLHLHPHDLAAYTNTALEDVPLTFHPWNVLARRLVHAGTFPAWDPYAFGGTPFFANPEIAWFSPYTWPLWILPLNYAFGFVAALKLWTAGFGAYLLARELRLSFWPGMLAGVSFALCAFNVVWLAHGVQVLVAVLFPWLLLFAERIVRRGRPVDGLAFAGVVALLLAGGHPGTQLHVLSGVVLYVLVRVAVSSGEERLPRARRLVWIAAGLIVGGLVMAIAVLPAQQAAQDTAGAFARRNGSVEFLGTRLTSEALRTIFFPDWWGRPSEEIVGGPAAYNERTLYVGVVALVFAALALVSRTGWRRKAPLVVLAAIGAMVPVRALGTAALLRHLPLFDSVQNQRILLWFLMATALLGAFGLQALIDEPRQLRLWGVLGLGFGIALVGALSAGLDGATLGRAIHLMIDRDGSITPGSLSLASVLWWVLFAALLAVLALVAWQRPAIRRLLPALVVLVAVLDMQHFAHGYQPMGPASKAIPPSTPAIAYLQRHQGEQRIAGVGLAVPSDWGTIYGLRDAHGYDQPQPSLRFFHMWQTIEPETTPGSTFRFASSSRAAMQVLGLLGARLIVANPEVKGRTAELTPVYQGRDATIFDNKLAMPRAIVADRVRAAGDEAEEIGGVVGEGFDPRRDAVVRSDELGDAALPRSGGRGTVRVVGEQNSHVSLRAQLPHAGLVVLDDAWAPGWSVKIDGRPARALQTDVVLRGVVVPAGTHAVEWSYRVPGLRAGALLSLLGLLLAGGWGGWLIVRRRRESAAA